MNALELISRMNETGADSLTLDIYIASDEEGNSVRPVSEVSIQGIDSGGDIVDVSELPEDERKITIVLW